MTRQRNALAISGAVLLAACGCTSDRRDAGGRARPDRAVVRETAAPVLPAGFLPPQRADYAHMWWAEGFPSHTPDAPWLRIVQTGRYAMALETETLRIPRLGPLPAGDLSYAECATADNRAWQALPSAELALTITVEGKEFHCRSGGKWTRFAGPRLIESGGFMQRADVRDLEFAAPDGERLNVEARFETAAWPDRLALILAARPGVKPIPAGDACFGRVGGGFGLDGTNHLEIPHSPELEPEQLTLELWAFVPTDCQVSQRTHPWLVCKNGNEWADGNYGFMLIGGRPRAWLNIGGGRENTFHVDAQGNPPLHVDQWNHLAMTYDGDALRVYINGRSAGDRQIGRKRTPGNGPLAFGRRQDNSGDGYYFRGVVDEIRIYDRALSPQAVKARAATPEAAVVETEPVRQWSFRDDGLTSLERPCETWQDASMAIRLATPDGELQDRLNLPNGRAWTGNDWQETAVVYRPHVSPGAPEASPVTVKAVEIPSGAERPAEFDPSRGWYRIDLNGIEPTVPNDTHESRNDAVERVSLMLSNPDRVERTARLLFDKDGSGIRQRIGAGITGMSAVLRDSDGNPTGIPVQISKNWHGRPEGGVYRGTWFHGFSQVRIPPGAAVDLELTLVYGHWGGVAAASHAQLCLIGWGSNQLWDQSALGSWGESICYEPDQAQAAAAILDVRPLMVSSMNSNQKWHWTHNVGGGDFFRFFDPDGNRVLPARMKTAYLRQCPVLTDVLYAGHTANGRIEHQASVSLQRSDDLVRGVYRLRMDVTEETDFSRFVIFQIGADTYSYTGERKMALGNETGVTREWDAQWGDNQYKTEPIECAGRTPWISLHEAVSRASRKDGKDIGAWANRGIVIRAWKARLGGRDAVPWAAEHGVNARGADTSTIDILPPPGVTRFLPGDYVEVTVEHVVMPQFAADYYGPNTALRAALEEHGNTWRMIHREAVGNDRRVDVETGTLERCWPAVRIAAELDRAEFAITGGLGYVPITICGLGDYRVPRLEFRCNGGAWRAIDQSVHGRDFWQVDYCANSATWEITFSVPCDTPNDEPVRQEYRFMLTPAPVTAAGPGAGIGVGTGGENKTTRDPAKVSLTTEGEI